MVQRQTRRIAIVAVALALLATVAWWHRPSAQPSPQPGSAVDASRVRPGAGRARPAPRASQAASPGKRPAGGDPRIVACDVELDQRVRARREQLQVPRTPDEAIERALLGQFAQLRPHARRAAAADEFRAARQRWPDSLDLAWFSQRNCTESTGCDRDEALHHLLRLDADNAAVWMLVMEAARRHRDEAGVEHALQRAAHAKFYDARMGTTYLHSRPALGALAPSARCLEVQTRQLEDTLGRTPNADDWADVMALAMEMAAGMPAFGALSDCDERERPLSAARRRACLALLSRIADGDTLLEQHVALRRLVLLAGDAPGSGELRERYRQLRWLTARPMPSKLPPDFFRRLWTDGELAMLRRRAIAEGRWPPPPDWLPPDAQGRALILTGRLAPE